MCVCVCVCVCVAVGVGGAVPDALFSPSERRMLLQLKERPEFEYRGGSMFIGEG